MRRTLKSILSIVGDRRCGDHTEFKDTRRLFEYSLVVMKPLHSYVRVIGEHNDETYIIVGSLLWGKTRKNTSWAMVEVVVNKHVSTTGCIPMN